MKHGAVLLADTHAPMLEGVRSILDEYFEVVVMVAHQNALSAAIERLDPEVAVIDVTFPTLRTEHLAIVRDRFPLVKVIALSVHDERVVVDRVFALGHNHLKLKEYSVESNVPVPTEKSLKPDHFVGNVTLRIDGKEVGTLTGGKSAGQYNTVTGYGLVTGRNPNTPATHQYESPFAFTGDLEKVTIVLYT